MDCKRKGCKKQALDWKVCAQCFKFRYCSEQCLVDDWESRHEEQCEGHTFSLSDLIPNDHQFLSTLGKGTYSDVNLVSHSITNKLYAVKIISKSIISIELPIQALFREISLHKSLVHDNIIQLYDQLEDEENIYIVLEYANKCDLRSLILKNKKLSEIEAANIFAQVCIGLRFMHHKGILHRDIKTENILINESGVVKICDLGWSAYCDKPRSTFCGTFDYLSPEIIQNHPYSFPSDIWSLGVLLFEMLQGTVPFGNFSDKTRIQHMLKKNITFAPHVSQSARGLILKILTFDPKNRFKIDDILKHRWLQENYSMEYELEVGVNVVHKDFGRGVVVYKKGLICSVDFTRFSLDFTIPELVKSLGGDGADKSIEILKVAIGRDVSPIPNDKDHYSESSWKLEDSYSGLTGESTYGGPSFFSVDYTESSEKFQLTDRQKELEKLQAILEPQAPPVRKYKKQKTMIQRFIDKLS